MHLLVFTNQATNDQDANGRTYAHAAAHAAAHVQGTDVGTKRSSDESADESDVHVEAGRDERRARRHVHVPQERLVDEERQLLRRHEERVQEVRHEARVRPPELLSERQERAVHRAAGPHRVPGPAAPRGPLEGPLPSLPLCLSLLSQRCAQATTALQRASAELGCSPILNAADSSGTTATRLLRYA